MSWSPGLTKKKIIVTDNGGVEHEFIEVPGDVEQYLETNSEVGNIEILTRSFSGKDLVEVETVSIFLNPRRVDVVFVRPGDGER